VCKRKAILQVRVTIYHAPFHTNDLFYSSTRLEPFKGVVPAMAWTSSGWQAGRDGGMAGRARYHTITSFSPIRRLFIRLFKPNEWIFSLSTCLNTARMYLIMQTFSRSLSFSISKSLTLRTRSKRVDTFHSLDFFRPLYTHIYLFLVDFHWDSVAALASKG
jgi:hypothetical protein